MTESLEATSVAMWRTGQSPTLSGAVLAEAPGRGDGCYVADMPAQMEALRGHYPGYPIVPGVFLVDLVAAAEADCQHLQHLGGAWAGVRTARFRSPVFPGQRLLLERALHALGPRWVVRHSDGTGDGTDVAVIELTVRQGRRAAQVGADGAGGADGADRDGAGEPWGHSPPDASAVVPSQVIPHRPPMLLVDRVVSVTPGRTAEVVHTVAEQAGGLVPAPAGPVMPWPLVVESWAQAAALLAAWDRPSPDVRTGSVLLFGGARDVQFGAQPLPGTVLEHRVEMTADTDGAAVLSGSTWAGSTRVLSVGRVTVGRRPPGTLPGQPPSANGLGGGRP